MMCVYMVTNYQLYVFTAMAGNIPALKMINDISAICNCAGATGRWRQGAVNSYVLATPLVIYTMYPEIKKVDNKSISRSASGIRAACRHGKPLLVIFVLALLG